MCLSLTGEFGESVPPQNHVNEPYEQIGVLHLLLCNNIIYVAS